MVFAAGKGSKLFFSSGSAELLGAERPVVYPRLTVDQRSEFGK